MTNSTEYIKTNIIYFRKKQGISQEVLSEKSEISVKYLSEIERGIKTPSIKVLEKIANALKIKIFQLFIN